MNPEVLERLKSIHTASIDARNGYQEAVKEASRCKDLIALFRKMMDIHEAHATEIEKLLVRSGVHPADDGSFMSTIHRSIMDIRAIFGGLDESVLPGLIDGEQRNVSHYDEALKAAAGQSEVVSVLTDQRSKIQSVIAEMQSVKEG